uniref:Putative peptidase s8 family domain in protein convertases n=1 Tax=Lutzomyia longipalpis TaxID=7200 RepID=A0A1B0GI41_LUTLO
MWAAQPERLKRDKRSILRIFDAPDNALEEDYPQQYDDEPQWPEFNDELWQHEWYLKDTRSLPGLPKLDLNVLPVYERGITGRGIRVAVLDDGVEYTHEDLAENYDPEISWDCNHDTPDARPNFQDHVNSHGTRCAGEIAMVANNRKCGVGIAFGAKVGGIKLLGGHVYDLIEGMALGFAHDKSNFTKEAPNITWRDVQHIIVNTAEYIPLQANKGWTENAAGLLYNIRFGFGLMNADAFVTAASTWMNVPPKSTEIILPKDFAAPRNLSTSIGTISVTFDNATGRIRYLEHVEVQVDLGYTERGVLEIFLTSPRGTKVQLLTKRNRDKSKEGFRPWIFMSVATWSEDPRGMWEVQILDTSPLGIFNSGSLNDCKLILHGTEEIPPHLKDGPRVYNMNYVRR